MDCLEFLWSLGAGSDDDDWVPHNDVIHEDLDSFNFDNNPLFGPSSESDTSEESVTTPSLAVDSDVQMPCVAEHFFIGEPHRNPTEDPPPYLAPPIIQPQRPVRVYYQIQGEWTCLEL